jgi:peptidoglycan DL-endopeptidase CwlO
MVVLLPANTALADPSLADIESQIDAKSNQAEAVIEAYNKITGDLQNTQTQLQALQAKMAPLQANVDQASNVVNQIALQAYRSGNSMSTMSVLLNAGESDNFVDQLTTLEQLSKNQQHDISQYTDAKKGFDTEKKRLDDLLAAQNAQKTDLETKRAKIEGDIKALQALEDKAKAAGAKTRAANDTGSGTVTKPVGVSGSAGTAVNYAYSKLGDKYVYATAGPSTFDCSGLTMAAWKAAGKSLPHNAASQYHSIPHISRGSIAPGDLVFYNGLNHVAIYIGGNNVIHAPHTGDVVRVANIDNVGPIVGYGRP